MASEENNVPVESKEIEQTQNDSNKQPQEEKPSEEATAETTETPATQTAAQPPKPTVHKQNFEKDIIYLYQFSRTPVLPSLSPFCLKVETWLRLAALKYEGLRPGGADHIVFSCPFAPPFVLLGRDKDVCLPQFGSSEESSGLMSIGPTLVLSETVEVPGSSSIDGEPEVHGVSW
uniref:Uncharacterized protein n=1 Tax=Timema monikensis TaxID=170555 RepID=A0A7R9DZE8_9NEOP|nr:unnamed protein product [Timema monikensis]